MSEAESSAPQQPKKRVVGRPFQKGQSGNPGGLPKQLVEVVALARAHTTAAIQALADICQNEEAAAAARVAASQALLDRAWGKPTQPIEGADGPVRLVVTWAKDDA